MIEPRHGISRLSLFLLMALASVFPAFSQQTCDSIPPVDPAGNFFSNFSGPCYAIPLAAGGIGDGYGGDLNAQYDIIYYKLNSRYELIFTGQHPNARYWAISVYDLHEAGVGSISDANMQPLAAPFINPYQPGVKFKSGQKWAATVSFGGTEPGDITPGCAVSPFNVHGNMMDATQIHSGLSWNGDPAAASLPPHISGPNTAGAILVRRYYSLATTRPVVIVRDLTTGCAIPASEAFNTARVVTKDRNTYVARWRDKTQWTSHYTYADDIQPRLCYGLDTTQQPSWLRSAEWTPGGNSETGYIAAQLPPTLIKPPPTNKFIRIRLHVPRYPNIPCTTGDCSLTGNEEMRYMSISFQNAGSTLGSVKDSDFTVDANGYATLIVGIGGTKPAWITPENGYTWIDLSGVPNYQSLSAVNIRNIRPNNTFSCRGQVVPFRQAPWTPYGGLMADYAPVMDFPTGQSIPKQAAPFVVPAGSCSDFPPADTLQDCTVFYPKPPALSPLQ